MHIKIRETIARLRRQRDHALQATVERVLVLAALLVVRADQIRWKIAQTQLTPRNAIVGLATAAIVASGAVAGAMAFTGPDAQTVATTASVGDAARQLAAQRGDRAARTAPSSAPAPTSQPATKAPAASKPPAKPAPKQAPKPAPKPAPKWVNPMPGAPLSSCYGPRWGTMHKGIDFAGANGTKIRSTGAGTVVAAGWNYTGYGISVVVDHGNGYLSHYAHAQKVLVKPGWKVKPGQALALEGSTGDSTGPHLHFEVHKGMWNQVNPATWLRSHGVKIGC